MLFIGLVHYSKNIGLWIANVALGVWNTIKNIGLWFQNLFNAIWAIIQNIGFGIANFFLGIWESVKAMANNIGIAFSNAWIWIQEQFWKLVDSIMQGLKNIAEGVNNALGWAGINIDTSSFDVAKGKISELQGAYQDFQDIGAAWDTGFHTYEYVDVGAAGTPTELIGPKAGMRDITPTTYFKKAGGPRRITLAQKLELESMILL